MEDKDKNSVISAGDILDGFIKTDVINNICTQFKINEETASKLVSGRKVIKKNIPLDQANKYKALFTRLGLQVIVLPSNQLDEKSTPQKKSETTTDNQPLTTVGDFKKVFSQDIPRVKATLKYKLGILLVIIMSAVAPLIYLGIISALVTGIVSYSIHIPEVIANTKTVIAKAAFVVIPLLVMSVLLLFIIKPLFSRYSPLNQFTLKRKDHPALFNLVKVMCEKIGVPVPVKIVVNNEVNAAASAAKGLSSLLRGKLQLTIGLPLVACMSMREFAGVLAHEFGHFSQTSAMTAYYLINTINYWFYSRAYEQDAWDDRLDKWAQKADWNIVAMAAVMTAKLGIYLTRQMFKGLYHFNFNVTAFMSRHMEHDADVYESIISGSQQFKSTSIKLRKISYANYDVENINKSAWNESKLLRNIPLAISDIEKSYDERLLEHIENDMQSSETKAWDSHPADHERVNHVLKRNDPGMIMFDFPANMLCINFNKLCEQLTLHTYRRMGFDSPENIVCDNNIIMDIRQKKEDSSQSLQEFFNQDFSGRFISMKPMPVDVKRPASLNETIRSIRAIIPDYANYTEQYNNLANQQIDMLAGETYLENDVDIDYKSFNLPSSNANEARTVINQHKVKMIDIVKKLNSFDSLFFHRIQLAAKLMTEEQQIVLKGNLSKLKMLETLAEPLDNMENYHIVMHNLMDNDQALVDEIKDSIHRYGKYCIEESSKIIGLSKKVVYRKDGLDTLFDFINTWCEEIYEKYDPYNPHAAIEYSGNLKEAVYYHYYWLLAEVCDLSLTIERENGVQPIKLV